MPINPLSIGEYFKIFIGHFASIKVFGRAALPIDLLGGLLSLLLIEFASIL